jgi:hypothetical protein
MNPSGTDILFRFPDRSPFFLICPGQTGNDVLTVRGRLFRFTDTSYHFFQNGCILLAEDFAGNLCPHCFQFHCTHTFVSLNNDLAKVRKDSFPATGKTIFQSGKRLSRR